MAVLHYITHAWSFIATMVHCLNCCRILSGLWEEIKVTLRPRVRIFYKLHPTNDKSGLSIHMHACMHLRSTAIHVPLTTFPIAQLWPACTKKFSSSRRLEFMKIKSMLIFLLQILYLKEITLHPIACSSKRNPSNRRSLLRRCLALNTIPMKCW